MAEHLGKLVECDRCGKTHFLNYTGTEAFDGGYTKVDLFEKMPDGWGWHSDIGTLCDECETRYRKFIERFMTKEKEQIFMAKEKE